MEITDTQIINAAEKYLRLHNKTTLQTRDVYEMLMPAWRGVRGRKASQRPITLHHISRVMLANGYVITNRRLQGRSEYAKQGGEPSDSP